MVRRTSFEDVNCSIAQALEVVGDWWTPLILRDCFLGVTRFDDLQGGLGISRNVLAQRLDHLVDQGVLERRPYQEGPVRHDYRLTAKGRDLWPVLVALKQWGDTWAAPNGPPVDLVHPSCGHRTEVVSTCSECGERLDARSVRAVPGPGADGSFPDPSVRHAGPARSADDS